jgi:hypothetical protein
MTSLLLAIAWLLALQKEPARPDAKNWMIATTVPGRKAEA